MLTEHHIEIMFESLGDHLGARVLGVMTTANVKQDQIRGQLGHDEYHFDNNAFAKTHAYIEAQRALVVASLQEKGRPVCLASIRADDSLRGGLSTPTAITSHCG